MTSFRQIEANRRNATKSTGPKTLAGKERARRNAVRHGLTAETVIGALEDAEDYQAFEAAVIADYDAQSAVERELVLRLASLLWRMRRATTMETGLFEIHARQMREFRHARQSQPAPENLVYAIFGRSEELGSDGNPVSGGVPIATQNARSQPAEPAADLATCFLRLANLPSYPLDRLCRYEAILWPQAGQILFALDAVDRRKPQDRGRRRYLGRQHPDEEC